MNNKNTKNIFYIILVLTLLVLSSTYSLANVSYINQEISNFNSNMIKINKVSKNVLDNSLFTKTSIQNTNDFEKIISNEIYDEYNPSLAKSGNKALIAYESFQDDKTKIYYKTSVDYFQSWSESIYVDTTFNGVTYNTTFPSFTKLTEKDEYFGTFLSDDNTSYIFELSGSRLDNIALWDYTNITNSSGSYIGDFYDFKTPSLISFSNPVIPWVIGLIGKGEFIEEYDEFDCDESPMFFYRDVDDPSNSRTIVFFPEISNCSNISICLGEDNVNDPMVYGVCEIKNNSNIDILFFYGNPDIWGEYDYLKNNTIFSTENLMHPKIYAMQNNIYIVAETDNQGIVMYHSNNYGKDGNWILINVTHNILESSSKPVNPDIYVSEPNIFCSFVESGNLTVISSNNSGVNWTNPYVVNSVNGSVVEEYHYNDMVDNHNFVWTDNRNGNFDIYFYVDYISEVDLQPLDIKLQSDLKPFNINNLLDITVKNNGDSIAKHIIMNVTFSFDESEDRSADNIFEIEYLLPGETVTISRYLFNFKMPDFLYAFITFAGIKSINVEVDPNGLTGDVDTSNNNLNKDFTYEDIFETLGKYEDFFLLIKELLFV